MKTAFILTALMLVAAGSAGQQPELLKDINPGSGSSYIMYMTQLGNKVVFSAINYANSNDEPWVTDGTADGTFMLKEIYPGNSKGSDIGPVTFFNGEAYFSADDGSKGRELWKTDGTAEGTVMVKDINPGNASGHPGDLAVFKNALYFSAYHPDSGYELWRTTGAENTTELVANITNEGASTQPGYLYATSNYLYFNSLISLYLYCSDGTAAGSVLVSDQVKVGQLDQPYFTEYNGSVYFRGTDITGPDSKGTQLWKVYGSTASRVTTAVDEGEDLDPRYLTVASGKLFFGGMDKSHGRELWAYNGTSANLVKDTNPSGHGYMSGDFFVCFKNKLVFTAGDQSTGEELWVSDGTAEGTKMIKDIYPGAMSSFPISPVIIGDTLYFSADDGTSAELWRLTSPDGQPEKFTDITGGGAYGPEVRRIKGTFVFVAGDATNGTELWKMKAPQTTAAHDNINPDIYTMSIYPNPATESSIIEMPESFGLPADVRIYDSTGQMISAFILSDRVSRLNDHVMKMLPGIYILKAVYRQQEVTTRFIVSP